MDLIRFFHRFEFFRRFAKIAARKINLKQKFYSGYIFLNAVDHSWAWTGHRTYATFDTELQNFIHTIIKSNDYFIDIGCNLGVMTVGTLLHDKEINVIAIDPNIMAIKLLKKSLAYNKLTERCEVIRAAIGAEDGIVKFDSGGSVTGHVADAGDDVEVIKLSTLLNTYCEKRVFVKVDIEGYEAVALNDLVNVKNLKNFSFIIELHPLGFNNLGDPEHVIKQIKKLGGRITGMDGTPITTVAPQDISQIIIDFENIPSS